MEVTRIQPQKPPLQMLFRVTFASVVFLLVVSIWAIVNYCQDERTTMSGMHATMVPTYKAFDDNRAKPPITHIRIMSDGNTVNGDVLPVCTGDHTMETIFNYDGNKAGYKDTSTNQWYASTILPTTTVGS